MKVGTPYHASSHCWFSKSFFRKGKEANKNVLDEAVKKLLIFINLDPRLHFSKIFRMRNGKYFCIVKHDDHLEEMHLCDRVLSWIRHFFSWNIRTMVIQTWVPGRHFSENESNELVTSKAQLTALVASYKIQAFEQKLEFWIACVCHLQLESFSILKRFFWWNPW